jgi:hypothetical protein
MLRKERPRTRLVVLADLLGIAIKPTHTSRGGQVTKEFFREVAIAVGVPNELATHRDKVGLCQLVCNYLAIPFHERVMTARGARVTNQWFDAILGRLDSINAVVAGKGDVLNDSQLGRAGLAGHLRAERAPPAGLDLAIPAICFCCGDSPGARLGHPVLEAHCTMSYLKSAGSLPKAGEFVAVCPSCHKVLHLRGIQAIEFRRELRP